MSKRAIFTRMMAPLYATQIATFVVPAVTVPFLTRRLTLAGWGELAFMQSFAAFLSIFIEYGFAFSGTQQVAESRWEPAMLSRILSGVQAAKLLLALCAVALCCALRELAVPMLSGSPWLFWCGVFWAVGQALNLNWFFLGIERVMAATAVDLAAKIAAAASIFLLIHGPLDAWKVLGLQAGALLVTAAVTYAIALRSAPFVRPSRPAVIDVLRQGRAAMLFRAAESSYTAGGPMLLGFFAGPGAVGLFAGAEKIARGVMLSLLEPAQRTLYASVSNTYQSSRSAAGALVRKSALWTAVLAISMSVAVFVAAPLVIRIALGAAFLPAVSILRILCLLPPAVALKWSLGIQWMIPAGMRHSFARIVAGSCVLYLAVGCWLAAKAGAAGMALTAAIVEVAIVLACSIATRRQGLNPFFQSQAPILEHASTVGELQ